MNPEQFKEFLNSNEKATSAAIEKYVNGKIDKLTVKVDSLDEKILSHSESDLKFQTKIEPVLTAYSEEEIYEKKLHDKTARKIFYVKSALSMLALLSIIWGIAKFAIIHTT